VYALSLETKNALVLEEPGRVALSRLDHKILALRDEAQNALF
jgi:hypothetical protein